MDQDGVILEPEADVNEGMRPVSGSGSGKEIGQGLNMASTFKAVSCFILPGWTDKLTNGKWPASHPILASINPEYKSIRV